MDIIITTTAITASIYIPTMSEYLPITQEEVVLDSVTAFEASAAIAPINASNPENGMPTPDSELFYEIHHKIKQRCNMQSLADNRRGGSHVELGRRQSRGCTDVH